MVAGYHLIWTAYGWWLPNDPRGSSSHEIRVEQIKDLGELHHGRKAVQPKSAELRQFYAKAQDRLAHPLLTFTKEDIDLIALAFAEVIKDRGYTCYACAIMPDHVHMMMRRHREKSELMLEAFQQTSRAKLIEAGRRNVIHPVWGGPGWSVYLDSQARMVAVERYVRANPLKIGWAEQRWPFVTAYDGWMPGYRGM